MDALLGAASAKGSALSLEDRFKALVRLGESRVQAGAAAASSASSSAARREEEHEGKGPAPAAKTPANDREAEACWRSALELSRRMEGKADWTAAVLSKLASLLDRRGLLRESIEMLEEAIELSIEATAVPGSSFTSPAAQAAQTRRVLALASSYRKIGAVSDALAVFDRYGLNGGGGGGGGGSGGGAGQDQTATTLVEVAIGAAVAKGDFSMLEILTDSAVEAEKAATSAAVSAGGAALAQTADSATGATVLMACAGRGQVALLKRVVVMYAKVAQKTAGGNKQLFNELINRRDRQGATALDWAVRRRGFL